MINSYLEKIRNGLSKFFTLATVNSYLQFFSQFPIFFSWIFFGFEFEKGEKMMNFDVYEEEEDEDHMKSRKNIF